MPDTDKILVDIELIQGGKKAVEASLIAIRFLRKLHDASLFSNDRTVTISAQTIADIVDEMERCIDA